MLWDSKYRFLGTEPGKEKEQTSSCPTEEQSHISGTGDDQIEYVPSKVKVQESHACEEEKQIHTVSRWQIHTGKRSSNLSVQLQTEGEFRTSREREIYPLLGYIQGLNTFVDKTILCH